MKNKIEIKAKAIKDLKKIAKKDAEKIFAGIYKLEEYPNVHGNIKHIVNGDGLKRMRIGDYRVLFTHEDVICVISVTRVLKRDENTYK